MIVYSNFADNFRVWTGGICQLFRGFSAKNY